MLFLHVDFAFPYICACRKIPDPLENQNILKQNLNYQNIRRWWTWMETFFFQVRNTEFHLPCLTDCLLTLSVFFSLWFSQSVLCFTILLSVFVSLQPRALSILLWQWNSDDEPCLQGALPQGQTHTNKHASVNCAATHTYTNNMHVGNEHFFSYTLITITYIYLHLDFYRVIVYYLLKSDNMSVVMYPEQTNKQAAFSRTY